MDRRENRKGGAAKQADAVMWAAVVACDKRQDGRFWYGVTSTRIFCRPSCPSKTPKRGNVRYFDSPDEAVRAGYRPCKRCRPDQPSHDPARELAGQVLSILAATLPAGHETTPPQAELAARLDTSQETLRRAFKAATGETISTSLSRLRVDKARALLSGTDLPVPQVALESGFESLSNFYRCFSEHAGTSPARYRAHMRGNREGNDGNAGKRTTASQGESAAPPQTSRAGDSPGTPSGSENASRP